MRYPHKPNDKGQGSTEYALSVGLVCLVCLVGLTQMGGEISALLGNTVVRRTPALNQNGTPIIASNPSLPSVPLGGNPLQSASTPVSQVCVDQSLCVDLPDFSNGVVPQKSEDVAGGYGELSKQYAQALEDLVKQLQADPQYQNLNLASVVQLAKNGHALADNLQAIQETCQNKNKNQASGQCEYNASTLMNSNDPARVRNNFLASQKAALEFLQQSEALPPQVKNLIVDLSDQIFELHQASIGKELESVEGVAAKAVCQNKAQRGKRLPKRCKTTTTQANITVNLDAEAEVITLDANSVCDAGTANTKQCRVEKKVAQIKSAKQKNMKNKIENR